MGMGTVEDTVDELLKRLQNGFGFGDWPLPDQINKKTAAEIALGFSYDYLGEKRSMSRPGSWLQQKFRALGVFAQDADFSTEAVAAVWDVDTSEAEEYLCVLQLLSLVTRLESHGDNAETKSIRWQQHAVLRAYELSLLQAGESSSELQAAQEKHTDHFLGCLELMKIIGHPAEFLCYAQQEFKQITHAFSWCCKQQDSANRVMSYVRHMDWFFAVQGQTGVQRQWLEIAFSMIDENDDSCDKAFMLLGLGDLELQLGKDLDAARGHYVGALAIYKDIHNQHGQANALRGLGDLERQMGKDLDVAAEHYKKAFTIYENINDQLGQANALFGLGDTERKLGIDLDAARGHYEKALAIYENINHQLGQANVLCGLGDLGLQLGIDLDAARGHYEEALTIHRAINNQLGQANALCGLGDLKLKLGNDLDAARGHFENALDIYHAINNQLGQANVLLRLGDLELKLGNDLDVAHEHYEKALTIYKNINDQYGQANALLGLGDLERVKSCVNLAHDFYSKALDLCVSTDHQQGQDICKSRLAGLPQEMS